MVFFNSVKKVAILIAVITLTTACNEEAFYKQDYLESINDPNINLPKGSLPDVPTNETESPDGTQTLTEVSEFFTQTPDEQKKVDILWVIDDSGSMGNEQQALAHNFEVFINEFIKKDIDFKMAITTTDTSTIEKAGLSKADLFFDHLTSIGAQNDESAFINNFQNNIKVGLNGSGYEKGLAGAAAFLERYHHEYYFRQDAVLSIVFVSDEQDQSAGTVASFIEKLKLYKADMSLVKAFSIIYDQTDKDKGLWGSIGSRYAEASKILGGSVSSISGDFHEILGDMGSTISKLVDSFSLTATPADVNDINVYVDGQHVSTGWEYNAETRSISFQEGFVPAEGLEIQVKFKVLGS